MIQSTILATTPSSPDFSLRSATLEDVPALRLLIDKSVRGLQALDYSATQLESALISVYGVDTQLIADGTYYVAEESSTSDAAAATIVACGGWSKRKTLYGGDNWRQREDSLLDPRREPAKIRAFFVHPDWVRRGLGTRILNVCEDAARAAGFTRAEMGATLTGVGMYAARGYSAIEPMSVPLANGESLAIVRMAKDL